MNILVLLDSPYTLTNVTNLRFLGKKIILYTVIGHILKVIREIRDIGVILVSLGTTLDIFSGTCWYNSAKGSKKFKFYDAKHKKFQ